MELNDNVLSIESSQCAMVRFCHVIYIHLTGSLCQYILYILNVISLDVSKFHFSEKRNHFVISLILKQVQIRKLGRKRL
jgi:hypothetical protein